MAAYIMAQYSRRVMYSMVLQLLTRYYCAQDEQAIRQSVRTVQTVSEDGKHLHSALLFNTVLHLDSCRVCHDAQEVHAAQTNVMQARTLCLAYCCPVFVQIAVVAEFTASSPQGGTSLDTRANVASV